jgi:hypothetical protein
LARAEGIGKERMMLGARRLANLIQSIYSVNDDANVEESE